MRHHMFNQDIISPDSGPLATSEAELLALEEQHDHMIAAGRLVRHHLRLCDKGDAKTLAALDDLLKYIGIFPEVTGERHAGGAGLPKAEMAVFEGD